MAYYYSASERAFFSSDIVSTGSMPADKVAVTNEQYQQLMADQESGMLIRPGAGNSPESASQNLSAANRFGNVSFGTVTATGLDLNGNADISGTLVVGGASTLKGALAAQAGITATTITATGTTTLAALNATNITASGTLKVNGQSTLAAVSATNVSASGTLTVNGNSTLKALSATNISASGTLKVTGASTLTGKLTANGGLDTKAITATTLTTSGNATIGGLLAVTGNAAFDGTLIVDNSAKVRRTLCLWDERVTHGSIPESNTFFQINFGDKTLGSTDPDIGTNIFGFLEMGVRADGSTDLKMTAMQNVSGATNYASLIVGWKEYDGSLTAYAAGPYTPDSASKNELICAQWANGKFLRLDGSTRYSADAFNWTGSQGSYPVFRRIIGTANYGDNFVIEGMNQATIITSGECGRQANDASLLDLLEGGEDILLCADNAIVLAVGANANAFDNVKRVVINSVGNVTLPGHLYVNGDVVRRGSGSSTRYVLQNTGIAKGTLPTSTTYWDIGFTDSQGIGTVNRAGAVTCGVLTNGDTLSRLVAYKWENGSNSAAMIQITYKADGTVVTQAPTPPVHDESTQIATTAFVANNFFGHKALTSINSVRGCFYFDSLSGVDLASAGLDFLSNADWYGVQYGMSNGNDKMQFTFNSGGIWRRYSDSNFGSESWSEWTKIADATGLIAMTTVTPDASDNSTRIPSTAWVVAKNYATQSWVMDHLSSAIPPGAVMYFAQGALPDGWLICNGSNVSRTTYANLFAAIGTKYGSGNGSSTFTLPNLNAKFIEGTTTTSSVGQTVAAGLPNITGGVGAMLFGSTNHNRAAPAYGAFYKAEGDYVSMMSGEENLSGIGNSVMDASRVSSVYGASTTVQPPAVKLLPCIKY